MKQEEITIQKYNELLIRKKLEEIYRPTPTKICCYRSKMISRKCLKHLGDKYITIKLKMYRRAL